MSASKTYEIAVVNEKVVLELGDCAGGLTMIRVDAYLELSPEDAKWLGLELNEAAQDAEAKCETRARSAAR